MKISPILKWLLLAAGTLTVGALSSGLWELAFRPMVPWLATLLLNVATLGLTQLRDSLYVEIARGVYERGGLNAMNMIIGVVCGFTSATILGAILTSTASKGNALTSPTFKRLHEKALNSRRLVTILIVILILVSGPLMILSATTTYVDRAAAHMAQFQAIVAPYITQEQRVLLASRVSQMKSRDDYEKIIGDLTMVAKQHQLVIPSFNIY